MNLNIQTIIKNYVSVINRIRPLATHLRREPASVRLIWATSNKPQATSNKRVRLKPQATKTQAASNKPQAPGRKAQASSHKRQAP